MEIEKEFDTTGITTPTDTITETSSTIGELDHIENDDARTSISEGNEHTTATGSGGGENELVPASHLDPTSEVSTIVPASSGDEGKRLERSDHLTEARRVLGDSFVNGLLRPKGSEEVAFIASKDQIEAYDHVQSIVDSKEKVLIHAPAICFNESWIKFHESQTGMNLHNRFIGYSGTSELNDETKSKVEKNSLMFASNLSDRNLAYMKAKGYRVITLTCNDAFINSMTKGRNSASRKRNCYSERSVAASRLRSGAIESKISGTSRAFLSLLTKIKNYDGVIIAGDDSVSDSILGEVLKDIDILGGTVDELTDHTT
jgi:hypothetical protein